MDNVSRTRQCFLPCLLALCLFVPLFGPSTAHAQVSTLSETAGLSQVERSSPVINHPTQRPRGFQRFVVDLANVLSPGFRQQFIPQLAQLDRQGQAQISIVVLPNTDRELSELAPEWFNAWGIGHGERDDGILILVNQSRVLTGQSGNRIFVGVGSGIQGTLPDGRVGELLRTYARPHLNQGQTERALAALVPVLITILSTEPIKPAAPQAGSSIEGLLVMLFLAFMLFNLFSRRRGVPFIFWGGPGFGGGWSSGGGGGGWDGGGFGGGSSDGGGSGD